MNALTAIAEAIVAFVATNVDDVLIVFLLLAGGARLRNLVWGQYLGFFGILALSVAASFGAVALPSWVVRWLGVVPFVIGLRGLIQKDDDAEDAPREAASMRVVSIAAVTLANGGDNIAVYVPLFAGQRAVDLAVMIAVFLVGVVALTFGAHAMLRVPPVARAVDRWGHRTAPWMLMALGAYLVFGESWH